MSVVDSDTLAGDRSAALPTIATSGAIVGLAGLAWWCTVGDAKAMSSMVQGVKQVGRAMTFNMNAAAFMGMWTTPPTL